MKTGLLTMTDDLLIHIVSMLTAPTDLVRLQLTCPRFADKVRGSSEMLSIPEEAARRWLDGCSEQERGWVPRHWFESWLGLMHEVVVLRLPLAFGRAHATITLSENGAVATRSRGGWRAAASTVVMRSGRHYAQFTVVAGDYMMFGVIRPGWGVEGGVDAEYVDGHCFYYTNGGYRFPARHAWEGMQGAKKQGDRIGMLLDLDQGSMTVWKNGQQLGVMQAEGLRGPLCWAASLYALDHGSAHIESAAVPVTINED